MAELSNNQFRLLSYEDQQNYLRNLLLLDESEDESDIPEICDDSEDEWLPTTADQNGEESDVEDVVNDSSVRIELSDLDVSEIEDTQDDTGSTYEESTLEVLKGKDGTTWRRKPIQRQTLRHNILRKLRSGPAGSTKMLSVNDTFKCIFTDVMANIIIRETNRKAKEVYCNFNNQNLDKPAKVWKLLSNVEFNAYLAILINAGVQKSNNEHTKVLWETTSNPMYRACMGINRFWEISRFLRFDNKYTRTLRLKTNKAAAISEIFELLNSNLRSYYTPSECIVVDEQLFPFIGIDTL